MGDKLSLITVLGLIAIIITFVVVIANKPKDSFTELYFSDYKTLPKEMIAGYNYSFDFTVASHENRVTSYNIAVDSPITRKSIKTKVNPGQAKTITVSLNPKKRENNTLTITVKDLEIFFSYEVK